MKKKKKLSENRPNTAVIYVRVSSKEQVHGYSLGSQEKRCQEYCKQNGWEVLKVFVEEGESAKTADRTQLSLLKQFSLMGVGLKSATEVIEDTPTVRAVEGMLAVMAQLENDIKTDRTLTGMKAKTLDGYWPVGAPWGYKNVEDGMKRKIIVPDPEKAPIV